MKTTLTIEESARLIELGVDPKLASECMLYFTEGDSSEPIPSWEVWEDCGKLLCNIFDEVENVECKIVSKDSDYDESYKEDNPIFNLTDLLSILPKEIVTDTIRQTKDRCPLLMDWDSRIKKWRTTYAYIGIPINLENPIGVAPELIDALNSLLIWATVNGHINTEKK